MVCDGCLYLPTRNTVFHLVTGWLLFHLCLHWLVFYGSSRSLIACVITARHAVNHGALRLIPLGFFVEGLISHDLVLVLVVYKSTIGSINKEYTGSIQVVYSLYGTMI